MWAGKLLKIICLTLLYREYIKKGAFTEASVLTIDHRGCWKGEKMEWKYILKSKGFTVPFSCSFYLFVSMLPSDLSAGDLSLKAWIESGCEWSGQIKSFIRKPAVTSKWLFFKAEPHRSTLFCHYNQRKYLQHLISVRCLERLCIALHKSDPLPPRLVNIRVRIKPGNTNTEQTQLQASPGNDG